MRSCESSALVNAMQYCVTQQHCPCVCIQIVPLSLSTARHDLYVDGNMSEMCTGMTSMDPAEKPSTVLNAPTSPAVTKNTAILSGDLRAKRPMRFKYTSCSMRR